MIRYTLLILNIIIFTPLFSILVILVGLFDSKKKYTSYLSRSWAKVILFFSFVSYSIEGLDKIVLEQKYIIISNHQSFLDILVTFSLLPLDISFFTKKELFYIPIFGWALFLSGMISVDRFNKEKSKKSVDSALKYLKKTNLSILNYPEGTRTAFNNLSKFKKGGFILAIQSNIPILPISIIYSENNVTNNIRLVVDDIIETLNYNLEQRDDLIGITRTTIAKKLKIK
ncbi:MAG: hypothetical protein CMG66_06370 [Candidatus Marinimicrobia bacterium]|nr:hypothetical protein [Candidatus Neomarinimicrobiota bacterium]|tara:strand:+ start:24972 stop:25655 length:684 start_codon:yes stop_codon:yes gene_type:complete